MDQKVTITALPLAKPVRNGNYYRDGIKNISITCTCGKVEDNGPYDHNEVGDLPFHRTPSLRCFISTINNMTSVENQKGYGTSVFFVFNGISMQSVNALLVLSRQWKHYILLKSNLQFPTQLPTRLNTVSNKRVETSVLPWKKLGLSFSFVHPQLCNMNQTPTYTTVFQRAISQSEADG